MRPIAETSEAIERLNETEPDTDLLGELLDVGEQVRRIVPECVGLSVTYLDEAITFTLVASDEQIKVLDAIQYLDGGPCVAAATEGEIVPTQEDDLLDEDRWRTFAQAGASAGVSSTLSLPIRHESRLIGSVNLYGGSPNAFAGHHQELAQELGAWAEGAVTNADLPFSTRREAMKAPTQLDRSSDIHVAIGMVAAARGIRTDEAHEQLRQAAECAGVAEWQLAEQIRGLRSF